MSDVPPPVEVWDFMKWILGGVVSVLGWFLKSHDTRLGKLEESTQTVVDAKEQREELRKEIGNTRDDIKELRTETTGQFKSISDQLTDIARSVPRARRRR